MPSGDTSRPDPGVKLTYDDFVHFPDDGMRHELVDGEYEQFGVSEYWVVDPDLDVIKVYRLTGERYALAHELSLDSGDVLTTPLLPGLVMPLAGIFEE